jgi:3',5'-cyclic AMP phosphodiesterase CpdA
MDASRRNNKGIRMLTIAHLTDLHLDDELSNYYNINSRMNFIRVLDSILEKEIRIVVITGDLGEKSSLDWMFSEIQKREMDYFLALGNHDEIESLKK